MNTADDGIPLGLTGNVKISDSVLDGQEIQAGNVLWTENDRLDWLVDRLDHQFDYPVFGMGFQDVARQILGMIPMDPRREFAKKLMLSLRDGQMHSTVAIRQASPRVAVSFVTWRGTWSEMIGQRYGRYLGGFFSTMERIAGLAGSISGFLEIDAFIQERVVKDSPQRTLEECITLDVEYSYFPRWPITAPIDGDMGPLSQLILLNRDLCSEDEKTELDKLC